MRQIQRLGAWSNRYQAEFYAGATAQLTRAWIHNGFEESPQEITEITCELLKWETSEGRGFISPGACDK